MEVVGRKLHRDQIARDPHLRDMQMITWEKLEFGKDLEIYGQDGNLLAVTSRDNPNLDRLLADLTDREAATGSTR